MPLQWCFQDEEPLSSILHDGGGFQLLITAHATWCGKITENIIQFGLSWDYYTWRGRDYWQPLWYGRGGLGKLEEVSQCAEFIPVETSSSVYLPRLSSHAGRLCRVTFC